MCWGYGDFEVNIYCERLGDYGFGQGYERWQGVVLKGIEKEIIILGYWGFNNVLEE